jgi:fucose permease
MKPRAKLLLIGLAYLAFISLGLPDGLLGVGWPSIRDSFGLGLDALGMLLIAFTVGYLTSSFLSGWLLTRMSVGTLLALSCLATSLALLGSGLAPAWLVMVGLGLLSGFGGGAIDAGLNTYVATQYSARTLNWLHACFGIGATLGPLIMTGVLTRGLSWRVGYLIVGGVQLVLASAFALTRNLWQPSGEAAAASAQHQGASPFATLRLPAALLSIAVFFCYTGLEFTAGQWSYTLLTQARGVDPATAGLWVSLYWASLTVGRFVFGALAHLAPLALMLRACLVTAALGATLVWLGRTELVNVAGLVLLGLALAPIFPSLIAITPARLGPVHTANAVGFQVAAAALGGALLPGAVGFAAERLGVAAIGPGLFVIAAGLLLLYELQEVLASRRAQQPAEEVLAE